MQKQRDTAVVCDLDNESQHFTACLALLQWFMNSYLMASAEDFFHLTNINQTRNTVFKSPGESIKYFGLLFCERRKGNPFLYLIME